ncbi:MAG: UDP-N-acetylglucosamine--N-acetylmuramyl-(pentapeptide) pyrophosphoryl-undecaprenol N-acetylglucosamine transferase [Aquificae bacterium]|nr:UDP-N-acetylglucosamine--N-acetylmuramyl-(pentapeptide) pyrophosphoryl-undecaprenol N-acetylglucosamine transferase [Aquificota bacterium]
MIAVSGGGTGGHFFPALGFIRFASKKTKVKFVGARGGIEERLSSLLGVESVFLGVRPFSGAGLSGKVRALLSYAGAQRELFRFLGEDFSGLVFGGYASVALGLHTILRRKRLFVHEQNSVPGRANLLLAKRSEGVFSVFEHTRRFFPDAVRVGLPLREEAKRRLPKGRAREILGLDREKPTLLVFGGSQGARFLNELLELTAKALTPEFQVILISGREHYGRFSHLKRWGVLVLDFVVDMGVVYSASDVALARAGAGTINELAYHRIPALFVPYPFAVGDHQFYNAKEIEELGGGFVVRQEKVTPSGVVKKIKKIFEEREKMGRAIGSFFLPNAEERMFRLIGEG